MTIILIKKKKKKIDGEYFCNYVRVELLQNFFTLCFLKIRIELSF